MKKIYEEFFKKNKTLYSLDGELDPSFYSKLIKKFSSEIKNLEWNIICDPYVAVEDDMFRKHHNLRLDGLGYWWFAKKKDEWWKSHPLFDLAHDNKNIKIYISKKRIEPHFLIGKENNDLLVEEIHNELEKNISKVYLNNKVACDGYLRFWKDLLIQCKYFDKNLISFKPRTIFEQEISLEKEIDSDSKEYSKAWKR